MDLKDIYQNVIDGQAPEKVMIGGASVTQDYANKIGADVFAPDASSATRAVRQLLA